MSPHKEVEFEKDICAHLAANGWLYAHPGSTGDASGYDTPRALYPDDVFEWIKASHPQAWDSLQKSHGASAQTILLDRLRKQLDERGTLEVLRVGMEMVGLKASLKLAQFKPALAMNADLQQRYQANRLRVVRQVRTNHDDIIDLVLFLNGIPVATAELKTDFTQDINAAVDQYRFDRIPKPKGKNTTEPLLDFPRGALVHFAVSNRTVMMTTKLQGPSTSFLPFNLGNEGGAGNPIAKGHRTAYLWEQVWQSDSWLEIIGRYLVTKRDNKKKITSIIFPRYHQLDATRQLVKAILQEGPGKKYLIQHSAGSGKTNSIAWTAHFLSDLHNANNEKLFSTVLVVSDRTVLDTQLQEAIFDFERTSGVVATIKGSSSSKSSELAKALSGGKKIVVCTIQTFPFALQAVQELASTQGKTFAVIADEAHSSQTGEAASKLKQLLSAEELKDFSDGGEISTEDLLAAQMAAKANSSGITYVAFTATPKAKTLELFGRLPHPNQAASDKNKPAAFHVYSMRQAIEEGFILDVLKNYTFYKLAFKLAHDGKELDENAVERAEAMKGLMRWVRLHPYNISQKVQIVVEHFRDNVQPLLKGNAKAMVVVGSRVEAVRWKLAVDKYIASQGYKLGSLVAYSGEVNDPESFPDAVSETSKQLNPNLKGRDIRETFATDEYQILLVANKFQTGFDQPLLCGMYIDKRLAGIQAVQTLSRLNRSYNGPHGLKENTYILDFINEPEEILVAFKTYYETAELSNVTDPNIVYDIKAKLDGSGYYDEFEVDRVVKIELNPKATQAMLVEAIEPVADRLLKLFKTFQQAKQSAEQSGDEIALKEAKEGIEALELFKRDLRTFTRVYTFLSQLMDYGNTKIEKRSIFYKRLLPLLDFGREKEGIDLSKVVLTHHKLKDQGDVYLNLDEKNEGEDHQLKPLTAVGEGQVHYQPKIKLSEILKLMNDLFEGELTDDDKLVYVNSVLKGKLLESELLMQQAMNNSKEQFANSPDLANGILDAIMDALAAHTTMSKQALESDKVKAGLKEILLGPANLYESLRGRYEGRVER